MAVSFFVSPSGGPPAIGLVWIVGRILYAVSYIRDPESRTTGFAIGWVSALILLIGALVGVIRALWITGLVDADYRRPVISARAANPRSDGGRSS